jgi:hypothetical protein
LNNVVREMASWTGSPDLRAQTTLKRATTISGVVSGFIQATRTAEWSAYSLAAQSLASQCLEQSRAAKWDPRGYPPVDQLVSSNFPINVQVLDIPVTHSNTVYATNIVTITTLSTSPGLKMISVQCTWPFLNRGNFTNTVVSYRAPDQ